MTDNRPELAVELPAPPPGDLIDVDSPIALPTRQRIVWRRLKRHRLGLAGGMLIILLYLSAILAGFLSPNHPESSHVDHVHAPPMWPRLVHQGSLQMPFFYPVTMKFSEDGMERRYVIDHANPQPIRLFARGDEYRFLGLIRTDIHVFGASSGAKWFPLGTDRLGRCLLSRMLYGGRISLTVGLVGVFLTMLIGTVIGTASGYFGGWVDNLIQRGIELLLSFPSIPLWIALAAALPATWSPVKIYIGIIVILSLIGWGGLARQIRGLVLSTRERDFIKAARSFGASHGYLITRHLVPSTYGYLIVIATLAIPGTILGETALSFLGLGIRPPMISWGVLLEEAQKVRVLVQYPWLLIPAVPVLLTVVSFNLFGDALRDVLETT